ncbi:PREDICTED: tripartite motif-containing protein 35-like, partial [Galeopterus variegatus]|uniref:Tripartite motif-containing protein 35-like n=1 Tax=Galeopterus variegatus TaxID=482537 RepID=A0ABM0Q3Z2_GALVR
MEHSLREKAKAFWAMRRSYEAIAKHNQVEAAWLESRIRQEFDKLREFLRAEEQAVLEAMAEEARQKQLLAEEKMKQLTEETEALAHEIERLQMEMKEDDVSFLMVRIPACGRSDRAGDPSPGQPGLPRASWMHLLACVRSLKGLYSEQSSWTASYLSLPLSLSLSHTQSLSLPLNKMESLKII